MDFIESNLAADEKIMAKIKHSWAGMVSTIILFLVLLAFGIVFCNFKSIMGHFFPNENIASDPDYLVVQIITCFVGIVSIVTGLLILFVNIVEIKSSQLVVTNKRIFGRRGFIAKYTTDILISKVDTINVSNGFFGALFHYGNIKIVSGTTAAMTRAERATLVYSFVSNTSEFRKAVLETIDKVKREEQEAQARSLSEAMKNNQQ